MQGKTLTCEFIWGAYKSSQGRKIKPCHFEVELESAEVELESVEVELESAEVELESADVELESAA